MKNLEDYFDSFLPYEFRERSLPQIIAQKRKQTIFVLIIQFFSSIAGLSFYFFRRMPLFLIVNTISIAITITGLIGVLQFKKELILIHVLCTMSILGTFFLYLNLENLFKREEENV